MFSALRPRMLGLLLALMLFSSPFLAAAQGDLSRTFTTPDGSLSLSYPGDWRVRYEDAYGIVSFDSAMCRLQMYTPTYFLFTPEQIQRAQFTSATEILLRTPILRTRPLGDPLEFTAGRYSGVLADSAQDSGSLIAVLSLGEDHYLVIMSVAVTRGRLAECEATLQAILATVRYGTTALGQPTASAPDATYITHLGTKITYPEGWVVHEESSNILLVNSQEALEAGITVPGGFGLVIYEPSVISSLAAKPRDLLAVLTTMSQQLTRGTDVTLGEWSDAAIGEYPSAFVYITGEVREGVIYAIDYGNNQVCRCLCGIRSR